MSPGKPIHSFLSVLTILFATLLAGWPVLSNGFINFGDDKYVTQNRLIRSLSSENLRDMFSSRSVNQYNPLVVVSFALEYAISGLEPKVFHATNLGLHALNSILLFFLILKLAKDLRLAFVCGLMFGIHPLHVESYAWISERKDVLSTFFLFLATMQYLKFATSESRSDFGLTVIWFVLGILSKPIVVLFPIMALLLDWYRSRQGSWKERLAEKGIFLALSIIFTLVSFHGEKLEAKALVLPFSWWQNIAIGFNNLCWYLYRAFVPVSLSAFYPYPPSDSITMFHFAVSGAGFATIAWAVNRMRNNRPIFFGLLLFFLFLAPYLKLIPFGAQFMRGDRYFYLASIGLFFAFFSWILARIDAAARPAVWIAVFWLVFLGVSAGGVWQSRLRCGDWRNSGTLWLDALEEGHPSYLAYLSLGEYLVTRGAIPKAMECFQNAIELKPNDADSYNNLGIALTWLGRHEEGIPYLQKALEIRPQFSRAQSNLGIALLQSGKRIEAIKAFEVALQQDSLNAEAHFQLGQELFLAGDSTPAKTHLRQALELGYSKLPPAFFLQHPDLQPAIQKP